MGMHGVGPRSYSSPIQYTGLASRVKHRVRLSLGYSSDPLASRHQED